MIVSPYGQNLNNIL